MTNHYGDGPIEPDSIRIAKAGRHPGQATRAWVNEATRRLAGIRQLVDVITDEVDGLGRLMVQYIHGDPGHPHERKREPGPTTPIAGVHVPQTQAEKEAQEARRPPWLRPR